MISKWAYNYLTERLSCARVLPSVSATLLYCLANGAGVRNVVIYEKVSSYLRWIWCPFSGKMTFFEGKSVIVVNCCYKSSCTVVVVVVLKALLANRIYSRMTQGKKFFGSNSSSNRSWNTSSPEVEMVIDGILFVIDDLSFI